MDRMNQSGGSLASQVTTGLAAVAGAVLGIGFGFLCAGQHNRGRSEPQSTAPSRDIGSAAAEILHRLDRIEGRVDDMQARLTPVVSSVTELQSRLKEYVKDIEAIQTHVNDARHKQMDAEVEQLGALLVEVKHPILTSQWTQ